MSDNLRLRSRLIKARFAVFHTEDYNFLQEYYNFYLIILKIFVNSSCWNFCNIFLTHLKLFHSYLTAYLFLSFLIFSSVPSYAGNCTSFVSLSRNKLSELPPLSYPIDLSIANQVSCNNRVFLPQNTSRNVSTEIANIKQPQTAKVNRKKIPCPNCGKELCNKYSLKRHCETVCGKNRNPNGKFKCDKCEKTYNIKGCLTRHQTNHKPNPPVFKCSHCNNTYAQKSCLVRHIKNSCKEIKQISDDERKIKKRKRVKKRKIDSNKYISNSAIISSSRIDSTSENCS